MLLLSEVFLLVDVFLLSLVFLSVIKKVVHEVLNGGSVSRLCSTFTSTS